MILWFMSKSMNTKYFSECQRFNKVIRNILSNDDNSWFGSIEFYLKIARVYGLTIPL